MHEARRIRLPIVIERCLPLDRVARPWLRLALAGFFFVPLGVLLVAAAFAGAREDATWSTALYWTGLITIFAPAAAVIWSDELSRGETVALLVAVALGLYAVKALFTPGLLTNYDELLHYRTLNDIAHTARLFRHNPLLPVSPYYPGLEIVTHAVMTATGLAAVPAALVVIAIARLLMTVSLFLFLERVTSPPRLAGLGTLLYMTAPSFLNFDASFAYESLALPLSVFCLFVLRAAQAEGGVRRHLLNVIGALTALTVVVTHHVTSFILATALVGWTAVTLLTRGRPRDALPGGGWVAPLTVAAVLAWLTGVATATIGYLAPHAAAAGREALRIMAGEGLGRRLFESPGGLDTPLLERAVGIGSVALIMACIPFGILYVRKYQRGELLARFLVLSTLAYPGLMLLRFTKNGWEIGSRALAFICVPLAFVLASGLARLRFAAGARRWAAPVLTAAVVIVFLGGVVAGTSPVNRLPRPYSPGAYAASIEGEGLAAAEWTRSVLGPDHRMVADSTNGSLMGSYGRQRVLTSNDQIPVTGMFLLPFGDYQRGIISRRHVEYVVVDRRIGGVSPPSGFFFEKWERKIFDYGPAIDPWILSRFDEITGADRVFDSGSIQIYDVRRLGR